MWMSSMVSFGKGDLRTTPDVDFRLHNSLNPSRCQRMTVPSWSAAGPIALCVASVPVCGGYAEPVVLGLDTPIDLRSWHLRLPFDT